MRSIRIIRVGALLAVLAAVAGAPASAPAHEGEEHKNLRVIADDHKSIDKGMKALSKGLGVVCRRCHIKGQFESDDLPTKLSAREFLDATVGDKDAEKRRAALSKLLGELALEKAKDEALIWRGVDMFRRAESKAGDKAVNRPDSKTGDKSDSKTGDKSDSKTGDKSDSKDKGEEKRKAPG